VADFEWAVGIEDTFIGQPSGRRGRILDEYELIDHYRQWRTDLDLIASLGVRSMRYGVPWYRVNPAPGIFDWSWTDEVFEHMAALDIRPIVDLVHYGTPLWLPRSFVEPDYPARVAEYAAAMVERYGPIAGGWTPLNEPVVNADFSGQRGVWPPHLRGDRGYDRVLVAIAEGIARTIAAIQGEDPGARIVAVEPCDIVTSDEPGLSELVARRWQILFLPLDLVLGRVDAAHPMHRQLVASGISEERLDRLVAEPQAVDVVGVNFYPNMSRADLVTSRGRVRRRHRSATGDDIATALSRFHAHTGLPVMITETSDMAGVDQRAAWMDASVAGIGRLMASGVPVVGYTWFPVFSHIDWRWRRGPHERDAYWCHMGLWDLDARLRRERTPLADRYAAHVAAGAPRLPDQV
jgi:beta-glucosidase/6-phospho-beta-glucosidase/beta-galactosidase